MHLLLPPSEGKLAPSRGRPCDLERLTWPELTSLRRTVLEALATASARPDALDVLGVGASLADEVVRNTRLETVPAAAAEKIFSGVLYDALDLASLDAPARSRARRWSIVVTAAYGPVRLGDRIAPYRLAMGTTLPGVGPLAAAWRESLAPVLADATGRGLIVDMRSADYVSAWRPAPDAARRWVAVKVPGASHMAKHTRGLVARALVEDGSRPTRPQQLADQLGARFDVRLTEPSSNRAPWTLDVLP